MRWRFLPPVRSYCTCTSLSSTSLRRQFEWCVEAVLSSNHVSMCHVRVCVIFLVSFTQDWSFLLRSFMFVCFDPRFDRMNQILAQLPYSKHCFTLVPSIASHVGRFRILSTDFLQLYPFHRVAMAMAICF